MTDSRWSKMWKGVLGTGSRMFRQLEVRLSSKIEGTASLLYVVGTWGGWESDWWVGAHCYRSKVTA